MKNDQIVVYPIIIKYNPDSTDYPYFVTIPDLADGLTEGASVADAIKMDGDYIGTFSLDAELPASHSTLPQTGKDEIATLVRVNVSEYQRKNDNNLIR